MTSIVTFNLHGFNNGFSMLKELCTSHDIIAVQEHWLRPDSLNKLGLIDLDFNFHAVSGMTSAVSHGIIRGRPFGGVGFLWRKSVNCFVQFIDADPSGRCIVIKLNCGPKSILLFNIYFLVLILAANINHKLACLWDSLRKY